MSRDGARGWSTDFAVEASPHAGEHLDGNQIAYAGAAGDLDGDGWVDVYVTHYEDFNVGAVFADAIYRNAGGAGLQVAGQVPRAMAGRGVEIADYDGDGDPDVYVSNYRLRENMLFGNDGNGGLTELDEDVGAAGAWAHTISSSLGDLDGDGDLDILVGNFAHPGQPKPAVLLNEGGVFEEVADNGIEWVESYASFALADYDNDGDLDLFVTTVYAGDNGRLYRNRGDATFEDVTADVGLEGQAQGYGLSLGDLDGDGIIDAFIGGTQEANVFLGEGDGGHSVQVTLVGDGVGVNAAAIGARVTAEVGGLIVVREVQGGGNGGDRGGSPLRVHLGVGDWAEDVELEIRWPWAETCTYVVEIDTHSTLTYEAGCDGSGETGTESDSGDETSGGASEGDDGAGTTGVVDTTSGEPGAGSTGEPATAADENEAHEGCGCRGGRAPPVWSWLVLPIGPLARRRLVSPGRPRSCRG